MLQARKSHQEVSSAQMSLYSSHGPSPSLTDDHTLFYNILNITSRVKKDNKQVTQPTSTERNTTLILKQPWRVWHLCSAQDGLFSSLLLKTHLEKAVWNTNYLTQKDKEQKKEKRWGQSSKVPVALNASPLAFWPE